jgi:hypothetical protein
VQFESVILLNKYIETFNLQDIYLCDKYGLIQFYEYIFFLTKRVQFKVSLLIRTAITNASTYISF